MFECLFQQLYFNEHHKFCNQQHTIVSNAKRLCESEGYDSRRFDGLDLISTVKLFERYELNINIFTYDKETKSYSSFDLSDLKASLKPFAQYCFNNEYITVNLLMLNIRDKFHLSYIKNLETLTGFMICPKCKSYCYNKNKGNSLKAFNRHVISCDGTFKKKINLNKVALPYLPHLFNNKAYLYAYAHNLSYEPIRYYATFDFETVSEQVNIKSGDSTTILSRLLPITVASSIYINDNIITKSFCIRETPHFVNEWIRYLFQQAPKVIKANRELNPFIPNDYISIDSMTVLGFNSSKFDTNLFKDKIETTEWTCVSIIGSTSCFKELILKHKRTDVKLRFIDAKAFIAGGDLRSFVRDFSTDEVSKGIFPYEAIDSNNYMQRLSSSTPFSHEDFYSSLKQSNITTEEYNSYLSDMKNFKSNWDYLLYYNELDTKCMISPINNLINMFHEYKVDMLRNLSVSSCASLIKYSLVFNEFESFVPHTKSICYVIFLSVRVHH